MPNADPKPHAYKMQTPKRSIRLPYPLIRHANWFPRIGERSCRSRRAKCNWHMIRAARCFSGHPNLLFQTRKRKRHWHAAVSLLHQKATDFFEKGVPMNQMYEKGIARSCVARFFSPRTAKSVFENRQTANYSILYTSSKIPFQQDESIKWFDKKLVICSNLKVNFPLKCWKNYKT